VRAVAACAVATCAVAARVVAVLLLASGLLAVAGEAAAQAPVLAEADAPRRARRAAPETFVIRSVHVEGIEDQREQQFILQTSGLVKGQEITLPSGEAIADAIRAIYAMRRYSDVKVVQRERAGEEVDLVIRVTPEPTLAGFSFEGIKGRHEDDFEEQMPLVKGRPVRPSDLERAKQVIRAFYAEKGYLRTTVDVERVVSDANRVRLRFDVDRGKKIEVGEIVFAGNEAFGDGKLRGQMDATRENRWWRFWKGEKFKEDEYETDLQNVIDFYRSEGYFDARVVSDSVYYLDDEEVAVHVTVEEGNRYYVRDIEWRGNTVYTDDTLTRSLGFEEGDPYNGTKLEENLFANRRSSDVTSLYLDRGYMQFNVQPVVRVVGEDSLDITFDMREGEVYTFGDINITGNTKTKDHVVRRELYTLPGQTFSRSAIQESIRRLMQLSYFSQESLGAGPSLNVDDEAREVDLTYSVEEVGSDQLELSGTWGRFGLVLQLGFQFNNFSMQNLFNGSAWRPLPMGDGQKLGVNLRTNGRFQYSAGLSFTEPWFRGRPNPVGGSVQYSYFTRNPNFIRAEDENGAYRQLSSSLFYERRLSWPDDKFSLGTTVGHQLYDNTLFDEARIPLGVSQQVTVRETLTRNSLDNPMFPTSGSRMSLSAELSVPIGGFIQYHKWRFKTDWNVPMGENFSFGVGTNYGYIGSLTGEEVNFERFEVGGTPFDFAGFQFGTEPVFMRGYPQGSISPGVVTETDEGAFKTPVGGRILTKYISEFRWHAVESQQLQAQPYVFFDAANAWGGFDTFQPTDLQRSTGVGVRLFLPIVGMLEFNYGRNLDAFVPVERGQDGSPAWRFQFSIGQGIGN
jgi:outer membrane protein insertion porin family